MYDTGVNCNMDDIALLGELFYKCNKYDYKML